MASWLASQLKAAENLLEAVDRTVSSASVVGQAWAPGPGEPGQSSNTGQLAHLQRLPWACLSCLAYDRRLRATRARVW